MAFLKKIWKKGDKITSVALNDIENELEYLHSAHTPLDTNVVISMNQSTGKQIVATDKTAAELFAAVNAGKFVRANVTFPDAGETIHFPKIVLIDGQMIGDDAEAFYEFSFTTVSTEGGVIGFLASELSADDTVVFTQV